MSIANGLRRTCDSCLRPFVNRPPEVYKVIHQVDVLCCHLKHRLVQALLPDVLNFHF